MPWFWELEYRTPRNGSRPFEIAHLDHTQLDIELLHSSTGQLLGKPWLTLLLDAYSRRVLAAYLTFDPPSYHSVMMVLRICVQRFERLPPSTTMNCGKEFHSVYFDSLLARYRCAKKVRPWAKLHFGSVYDERFLKATCPTTTKGTALVQKGSGIKLNHFYYWNTAFQGPEVIKTAVPVRYDPFDISTAYALVEGH